MQPFEINASVSVQIAKKYDLTPMQRITYETLRVFKGNDEHTAHPGIGTIATNIGCCRNTAKKYINQLVDKGVVWITERPITLSNGKKWNDTHLYTFVAEKYGESRKKKSRNVQEQTETGYQKVKKEFISAKDVLSEEYGCDLCDEAFSKAIDNIRRGVTKYIKMPLNYMKAIVLDLKSQNQMEQAQSKLLDDPEVIAIEDKSKKTAPKRSVSPKQQYKKYNKKTSFHNFDQRSSRYTNEDLEKMISEKKKL